MAGHYLSIDILNSAIKSSGVYISPNLIAIDAFSPAAGLFVVIIIYPAVEYISYTFKYTRLSKSPLLYPEILGSRIILEV